MDTRYLRIRRVTDRAVAGALLLATAPLLGAIALSVRLRMGSPVLFRQERVGEGGRVFRIAKFRTMVPNAEQIGGGYEPPELNLITPLGRFLRSTSLDELPQLLNVVKGEMAFIGPRPALPSQYARYTARQRMRVAVPQGITGLAQVRYRESAPWSKRIEADLEYARGLSLRRDAAIAIVTVGRILSREGVRMDATAAEVDDLAPDPVGQASADLRRVVRRDRAVGSDFPSPSAALLGAKQVEPPWGSDALLVQTGRQALSLLAEELDAGGPLTIAMPAFACQSMLEPFERRGWRIVPLSVSATLRPDLEAAAEMAASGSVDVVLSMRYFGTTPDDADRVAATAIRSAGAYLIADETHHPFAPGSLDADASIASLRKVFPVAGAAYIVRRSATRSVLTRPGDDLGRWGAMDASAEDAGQSARDRLRAANARLEEQWTPRLADARSRAVLQRLRYDEIAMQRRRNAEVLAAALASVEAGSPAISFSADDVPSHFPVRVGDPLELQQQLARRRIFCPVHWPQPVAFAGQAGWQPDLLSLPVDHRYGEADMLHMADAIRDELRRPVRPPAMAAHAAVGGR